MILGMGLVFVWKKLVKSSVDMVLWMVRLGRESMVGMNIKLFVGNDF